MKRNIILWQAAGFAAVSIFGTLLHFIYDWAGESLLAAPFSGINESTWEHMKLLFWPMFLFALLQQYFFPEQKNFWCIKARGTLLGLLCIPVLFYTYNGAIGPSPDWLNISFFFLSAAAAYIWETQQFLRQHLPCRFQKLSILLLWAVAALFIIFTFFPPALGIFQDPLTKTYGLPQSNFRNVL